MPVAPSNGDLPTFRVLTLGASGSGKSVFLASLFHELDHRTAKRRYFLDTDPDQRISLGEIYGQVSDTTKPWPVGTRVADMPTFSFDCIVVDNGSDHDQDDDDADAPALREAPVLRVSFVDYAGELLERAQADGDKLAALVGHMAEAHALLVMLDGLRIRQLLLGEPEGLAHFQHKLRPMFGFMQKAKCPIHLVVTKWDLVRDVGEAENTEECRLDVVIEALLKFEHIRSLVEAREARQVVRLIPVSAVGKDFAELTAHGEVGKRRDGKIVPKNIEVPLCAVLLDLFRQIERTLDEPTLRDLKKQIRDHIRKDLRSEKGTIIAAALGRPAAAGARLVLQAALGRNLGREATSIYMGWMTKPLGLRAEQIAKIRDAGERNIAQRQRLRKLLLEDFDRTVLKLEANLPRSELSRTM